jgi:putative FmdB family regulatory protein
MPVYEYFCTKCNLKFESLRSMSKSDEDAQCPQCNHAARRVFSRFASFSKGGNGESSPVAGTGSSCGGCTSASCKSCH